MRLPVAVTYLQTANRIDKRDSPVALPMFLMIAMTALYFVQMFFTG